MLILDETTVSKLSSLREPTEIRNQEGKLVGTFTPAADYSEYDNQAVPQHVLDKFNFDDAEFDRRRQTTHPGYTIEQVREHLGSVERGA
jgi:hypothetical protein